MRRTVFLWSAVILLLAVAFVFGLKTGFDLGMAHSFYVDAPAKGVIATQRLNALHEGKLPFVITGLEFEVDQSILWHNDFLNSRWV